MKDSLKKEELIMKKLTVTALMTVLLVSVVHAYNPPAGGESLFELSSPAGLTGGFTAAGGALFSAGPDSLIVNPALAAGEQRTALNLGYTALISTNEANSLKFGSAVQAGLLVPLKLYVVSGYLNGTFVPFEEMNVRNSISLKGGISKEITDKLDVGLSLNTGFAWGNNPDWALGANLGGVYNMGNLAFMKDFRIGASILNLGKNFSASSAIGLKDGDVSMYPALATIKAGVSATLVDTQILKLGGAADITVPFFQNVILDLGLKASVKDMLVISVAEKVNLVESLNGSYNFIPSIGLSYRFSFDVHNSEYLEKNGWSESEMTVMAAYKPMYSTVHGVSVGVDVDLGMKDETPPVIEIKFDDDDEE